MDSPSYTHLNATVRRFIEAKKKNSLVLCWAFVVGIVAGFVSIMFELLVKVVVQWKTLLADAFGEPWLVSIVSSAVLVYVAIWLVRIFAPEAGGGGIHEIEGALDDLRPLRWKRVLPVKFVGSVFSLGSGLALGPEGPAVQMGGNLGQMIAEWFRVSKEEAHILIAAGAGAGLSAAFNAPLAGMLFVIEEMRPQFRYTFLSFQSVLIATATANIVALSFTGQVPILAMSMLSAPPLLSLWLFLLCGTLFGLFGVTFNFLFIRTLDLFSGLHRQLGNGTGLFIGAFIGFLWWIFPDAVGEGDDVIRRAFQSSIPSNALLMLFVVRSGTTMLSAGFGAPGGLFAPLLALGTLFGMWFGEVAHTWFPTLIASPITFAVAGMCALLSATVRTPLMSILLTVEITGNYTQILPLIVTCMTATLVAQGLGGKPIYTVLLQRTLEQANSQKA